MAGVGAMIWAAFAVTAGETPTPPQPSGSNSPVKAEQHADPAPCQYVKEGYLAARADNAPPYSRISHQLVFSAEKPRCSGWTVVNVYAEISAHRPRWIFKRTRGQDRRPPVTSWATSEKCPAMLDSIEQLKRLPLGFRFNVPVRPGLHDRQDGTGPGIHGTEYVIETIAYGLQPDGTWAGLRVASMASQGSVGRWVIGTLQALESCWSEVQPVTLE